MSLLIEKSVTVLDAVYSGGLVRLPQETTEVIRRTPIEGEPMEVTPSGYPCTMLLCTEIDNSVPFTCYLNVNTSKMNIGDQLFVCTQYSQFQGEIGGSKLATVILSTNMICLYCSRLFTEIRNQYSSDAGAARKQQTVFTFDGEYLICTYDTE